MSYVSLYRKYRSQTFDDVVGQDHVVRTIKNAISAGRIGQGYLFCGSRGTGKTTVARLIAKALNCQDGSGPTPDPCNKCEACLSITAGAAVDVVEMDAASNRGVDDVDALRDGVKYPPMRLRYKVYIIDEAHQLSPQAKDAFLKTLEEPPPHAVFILATTEAGKIPITIRSRCQQFDFRRGTLDEIGGRLKLVVDSEGVSIDDDALALIARAAAGSYRDGLSVLEQVMAFTEGTVTAKEVYTVAGMVDEDVLLELGEVILSGDTATAFALADRLLREGSDVRELLKSAANHFRDLLALKVGAESLHAKDGRWSAQAAQFTQERLVHIIEVFSAVEKDLKWNEQHRLGLEMALLKALAKPREAAPSAPVAVASSPTPRPAAAIETPKPAPVAAPPPPPPPPAPLPEPEAPVTRAPAIHADEAIRETEVFAEPEMTAPEAEVEPVAASPESVALGDIQRDWQKILMHMKKVLKGVSESAVAKEGVPTGLQGNLLTVSFDQKHKFHKDATQQNAEKISEAILQVTGAKLKIVTVFAGESEASGASVAAADPLKDAVIAEHPHQNTILTMFDGNEIDPGPDPWEEEN